MELLPTSYCGQSWLLGAGLGGTLYLVRVECPSLGELERAALLVQGTLILSGPLRNITGLRSQGGELENRARLRRVPRRDLGSSVTPAQPFLKMMAVARGL